MFTPSKRVCTTMGAQGVVPLTTPSTTSTTTPAATSSMQGDFMHTLTPNLVKLRDIDMRMAMKIAGFAGMTVRDSRGNILPDIWCKYADISQEVGKLIQDDDIRRILLDQIKQELEAKKELLIEVEDKHVIAQWIVNFSLAWEEEYRKKVESGWDISQQILTVMHETVNEVRHILDETVIPLRYIEDRIAKICEQEGLVSDDETAVRFLFRNPYTSPSLCLIAGKIMQKKIVCNRGGAYSAKVQRNDITMEVDRSIQSLCNLVEESYMGGTAIFNDCKKLIDSENFENWIKDHRHSLKTVLPREN